MSLPIETKFAQFVQAAFEEGDAGFSGKVLEQENVSFLQGLYGALIQADLDSFADMISPDAEMELFCPREFGFIKRAQGKDTIVQAIVHNFSLLKDQETKLLSLVAQGDTVIIVGREKGKFRETNENYDVHFVQQFTIICGKMKYTRQIISFSE